MPPAFRGLLAGAGRIDDALPRVCIPRAMNDDQLLRYSRQILLPEFGIEGQYKVLASRVLIVGAGGLGSPVALYLAAAGVGHLVLTDFDRVDLSNLQRQIIHHSADVGRSKVESARDTLLTINPQVRITTIDRPVEGALLDEQVALADVVVDASDNFATRFAVNAACVARCTPLVSGAAIRLQGQVAVFNRGNPDSPCYRCLYPEGEEAPETCVQTGILAPVVGVIGSIQALETLKLLSGIGASLTGHLLTWDALSMRWRTLRLLRDPACPVCAAHPERRDT
jgi:molybdopterin/thiamine biosynthesis adenylyltransferase